MKKIVLTGGPCAGKTTVMSHLIQSLEGRGYKVFIIPETPTELILNGIFPCEELPSDDFQKFVLDKQLWKENLYYNLDEYYDDKKAVTICDRGVLDALAYIDKDKFLSLLRDRSFFGLSDIWSRYDGIIHIRILEIMQQGGKVQKKRDRKIWKPLMLGLAILILESLIIVLTFLVK